MAEIENLDFDFGFTAVDEHELEAVQSVNKTADKYASGQLEAEAKLGKLYLSLIHI